MHDFMRVETPAADTQVRAWQRAYGMQVVLAIGLMGAAFLVAQIQHLPLRDPDDSIVGPSYVRLPLIAVICFLIDVIARSFRGGGGLVGWRVRVRAVVRERWTAPRVRLVLIGLSSWYLAYVGFRNLKSYVPFVRPHMLDDDLLRLDRDLALGHDPATLLHNLLGTGFAAHLMSFTYVAWIVFLTLSLVMALFWTSDIATACWYVTAVAVNWVLGVTIYYLVPSTGPIYARPEMFADLPVTQVTHIAHSWLVDRTDMLADPFGTDALQTIAAFASLHVSVMVTASLIAMMIGLRPIWIQWFLWVFLVLNVLATVYLGWHYLLDVFGGVAIGVTAVWVAAWGTGNAHRLPSLVPDSSRGCPRPDFPGVRRVRPRRWSCAPGTREVLDLADCRDGAADGRRARHGRHGLPVRLPWLPDRRPRHLLGGGHPGRLAGETSRSGDQDRRCRRYRL